MKLRRPLTDIASLFDAHPRIPISKNIDTNSSSSSYVLRPVAVKSLVKLPKFEDLRKVGERPHTNGLRVRMSMIVGCEYFLGNDAKTILHCPFSKFIQQNKKLPR